MGARLFRLHERRHHGGGKSSNDLGASLSKNDREQLKYAFQQQRVIITHDSDFLTLIRKEKIEHRGVLFFTRQVGIGEAIEEIEKIWLTYSAEDLWGAVLFLPMKT